MLPALDFWPSLDGVAFFAFHYRCMRCFHLTVPTAPRMDENTGPGLLLSDLRRYAILEKAICLYMIPICCTVVGATAMYIDTAGCWFRRFDSFGLYVLGCVEDTDGQPCWHGVSETREESFRTIVPPSERKGFCCTITSTWTCVHTTPTGLLRSLT